MKHYQRLRRTGSTDRHVYVPGPNGEPPTCRCHGVAMRWYRDRGMSAGGRWRCVDDVRQYVARCEVRRRASAAGVASEPYDRRAICERDGGQCWVCGALVVDERFDVDHIIPISVGGPDVEWNVAIACVSCNRSRQNRVVPVITEADLRDP